MQYSIMRLLDCCSPLPLRPPFRTTRTVGTRSLRKRMLRAVARQVLAATMVFAFAFPLFACPAPAVHAFGASRSAVPSSPSSTFLLFQNTSHSDADDSTSALRPMIERYAADRVSSTVLKLRFGAATHFRGRCCCGIWDPVSNERPALAGAFRKIRLQTGSQKAKENPKNSW
jgi:hypothetical protein